MTLVVPLPWVYAYAHLSEWQQLTYLQAVGGAVWHGVKGVSVPCMKLSTVYS